MDKKIGIIGGGNLGCAIALGMVKGNFCLPEQVMVTRRRTEKLETLANLGIQTSDDNSTAAQFSDVLIFAVKPFQILAVCEEIKHVIRKNQLVVSVATGMSINEVSAALNGHDLVFRAMPNTAIAIGESMTCICGKEENADSAFVEQLFNNVGETVFIQEELMNAATVLGACGIAYAMRFIRAASQGGIEIGFSADTAQKIAAQTVKGASDLLIKQQSHPESEIDKVTTPKGCTIAGLNEMEHQGFSSSLIKGILTSFHKI